MREIFKSGSVRGLIVTSGPLPQIRGALWALLDICTALVISGFVFFIASAILTVFYAVVTRESAKREDTEERGVNENEYKN